MLWDCRIPLNVLNVRNSIVDLLAICQPSQIVDWTFFTMIVYVLVFDFFCFGSCDNQHHQKEIWSFLMYQSYLNLTEPAHREITKRYPYLCSNLFNTYDKRFESRRYLLWKMMFFSEWHRHTRKKKFPSAPNRRRTYYLPISTLDALPLSYRRLVVARPLN